MTSVFLPLLGILLGGGLVGLYQARASRRKLVADADHVVAQAHGVEASTFKVLQDMAMHQAVSANERSARLEERMSALQANLEGERVKSLQAIEKAARLEARVEDLTHELRESRARAIEERDRLQLRVEELEAQLGGRRASDPPGPALA